MARFDLVIFDCDGVVVDSERIVHEIFGNFIRSLGADLDAARMNEFFLGRRLAGLVPAADLEAACASRTFTQMRELPALLA